MRVPSDRMTYHAALIALFAAIIAALALTSCGRHKEPPGEERRITWELIPAEAKIEVVSSTEDRRRVIAHVRSYLRAMNYRGTHAATHDRDARHEVSEDQLVFFGR